MFPRFALLFSSPPILLLSSFFLLSLLLQSGLFPELFEPKRVGHERLVGGLLLLLDRQQRVFPDLGRRVPGRVGVLKGGELFFLGGDLAEQRNEFDIDRTERARKKTQTIFSSSPFRI